MTPTILFLHGSTARVDYAKASHHWLAAEGGFRSFAVPWRNVRVGRRGTFVRGGYEALSRERRRPLRAWERIEPDVIVHRVPVAGGAARVLSRLLHAHPRAAASYAPGWREIGRKWSAELAFRAGAASGCDVPRPRTFLVEKTEIATALADVGHSVPLIFKPSTGSQCYGIRLSVPETFDAVAAAVARSRWQRFVTQELVRDPLLHRGRKVDLRVYLLVRSFAPLQVEVYREGVARIAAREYERGAPADALRELTGCSFRKRVGASTENLPISELLAELADDGVAVASFWDRVEAVACAACGCAAPFTAPTRRRRFFLAGIDLLPVRSNGSLDVLFLETNYVPQLNAWGTRVDHALRTVHAAWLADLHELVAESVPAA